MQPLQRASLSGGNLPHLAPVFGRSVLLLSNDLELFDLPFYGKNCFVKCPLQHVSLVL